MNRDWDEWLKAETIWAERLGYADETFRCVMIEAAQEMVDHIKKLEAEARRRG